MKIMKFVSVLLCLTLFIPRVYAFSYDMEINSGDTNVAKGTVKEIKIVLKNVQDVLDGFGACSMNIEFSGGVSLNDYVIGLNDWSVTIGRNYSFDTARSFVSDTEMFSIPVKIDGAGNIKLTNIECSDGETKEKVTDKNVSFTIKQDVVSTPDNSINENGKDDDIGVNVSHADGNIKNVILSEGSIDFNPEVYDYTVKVTSFADLDVSVEMDENVTSYTIDKVDEENNKSIEISIVTMAGTTKNYTINVVEELYEGILKDDVVADSDDGGNFSFVPIFIGIICVLVLLNVFRIVKKLKK